MFDTLRKLTKISPPRNHSNMDSLNIIAEYIYNRFKENGLSVSFQEFEVNGNIYKNVIGVMNPEKEKTIIIGGHYDVCGDQQGADDNASAIAGLVETSKILQDKNVNYRLEFVAFCLEEPPYFGTENMGSYIHAQSIKDKNVIGMLNYEMIGYYSEEENSQSYPLEFSLFINKDLPTVGNFISFVANSSSSSFLQKLNIEDTLSNIETFPIVIPEVFEDLTASDHLNYWKINIPAIMITDTAHFRNPNYHSDNDVLETLNLEKMKHTIELTAKLIENLK